MLERETAENEANRLMDAAVVIQNDGMELVLLGLKGAALDYYKQADALCDYAEFILNEWAPREQA